MNRVLLTGATGFIGRQVAPPLLQRGYEVHAVSRVAIDLDGVQEHRVDLFDEAAVTKLLDATKPKILIHTAWFTRPPEYWHSPLNETWENRSAHLFEEFARNGGERIVGAGSCAEYEWGSAVLKEGVTPERPATPYGEAKLSLMHRLEALGKRANISTAWARFFFLFGPHERRERLVSSIVDSLLREDIAYCRNGELVRDFLYVEDAGDALRALALSNVQGTVNVASGIATRLGELADQIGSAMHLPNLVHVSPADATPAQPQFLVADVSRLSREVGWSPRFSRREAIERTIAWRAAQGRMNAV